MGRNPIYVEIAADYRAAIEKGAYEPGAKLPSLAEAAAKLGVHRFTIRDAYQVLAGDGLVIERPRVGYFVRAEGPRLRLRAWRDDPDTELSTWAADMARHGKEPETSIEVIVKRPPDRVAQLLGSDTPVVVRRAQHLMDRQLSQTADLYVPRPLAEGTALMEPDDIQPSVYELLAQVGHPVATETDEVNARPATTVERAAYALPPRAVMQEIHRLAAAADETPVFAQVITHPGEHYTLVYTRAAPAISNS